jgi:NDP-sugar pyrophosphorylase family protein
MKAMVFAAGLGTRLYPLTKEVPKALVEVGGRPLLRLVLEKLVAAGIREIVINVHHFPEMIRSYLHDHPLPGVTLHISDESDELLDTGGGLMKAAPWLMGGEPVLVHNVDVISDLDIGALLAFHRKTGGVATLAVRERETRRYLLFDREMRLTGWMDRQTGEIRRPEPAAMHDQPPLPSTLPASPETTSPSSPEIPSHPLPETTTPASHEIPSHPLPETTSPGSPEIPLQPSPVTTSPPLNEFPCQTTPHLKSDIPLAFSGIHVVDPVVFSLIPRRGRFSLIDAYLELAARYPVYGYLDRSPHWMDVGKPEQLAQAREDFGKVR